MNTRVHPNYQTKYQITNWPEYERALIQRGDITVWLSPAAAKAWNAKPSGRREAPRKYSDLAIETALTLRLVFHLPLRQTEGFLNSMFQMMGLDLSAPDHTTLSRRSQQLNVKLRRILTKGAIHLIARLRPRLQPEATSMFTRWKRQRGVSPQKADHKTCGLTHKG